MPEVTFLGPDGTATTVRATEGDSVMRTALDHDVPGIVGECGGACACATCHVYVRPGPDHLLPPVSELEDDMLEGTSSPRRDTSRLSCQLKLTAALDGLTVEVPEDQA
jgi:2Fe-2S ferredoxin